MAGLLVTALTSSAVKLGSDGVSDVGELLKLLIEVFGDSCSGVLLEPVLSLLDGLDNGLLVLLVDLAAKTIVIVDLVLQVVGIVLELVASLNALTGSLVLIGVLLSLLNHALDFLSRETALVVRDSDALGLSGALVDSRDLEDTVGIELEGDLDLRNATRCGTMNSLAAISCDRVSWGDLRNVGKLKLAKLVAVQKS